MTDQLLNEGSVHGRFNLFTTDTSSMFWNRRDDVVSFGLA